MKIFEEVRAVQFVATSRSVPLLTVIIIADSTKIARGNIAQIVKMFL